MLGQIFSFSFGFFLVSAMLLKSHFSLSLSTFLIHPHYYNTHFSTQPTPPNWGQITGSRKRDTYCYIIVVLPFCSSSRSALVSFQTSVAPFGPHTGQLCSFVLSLPIFRCTYSVFAHNLPCPCSSCRQIVMYVAIFNPSPWVYSAALEYDTSRSVCLFVLQKMI
jgi:hypothetical protein